MKFLQDFLEATDLKTTKIFEVINCSYSQALILQRLTLCFLKGDTDVWCVSFLKDNFEVTQIKALPYLKDILELISFGFINTQNNVNSVFDLFSVQISLSKLFLQLLENANKPLELPKITPYSNVLDYLNDEFLRLDLLAKQNTRNIALKNKLLDDIKLLDNQIKSRLKLTKTSFKILSVFKEHKLNKNEQIIFLSIFRSSIEQRYFIFEEFLARFSKSTKDKLDFKLLLSEQGRLISNNLIGYYENFSDFGFNQKDYFINEEIYQEVLEVSKDAISLKDILKQSDLFTLRQARIDLKDIILNADIKASIQAIIGQLNPNVQKKLALWGIKDKNKDIDSKIVFFGPSGTGKSITALALAKSLEKEIISFDCSKILSMYVGESEKNVRKIFDTYYDLRQKSLHSPILLLDEADQFLSTRGGAFSGVDKMHNQMQNIFLEQIEKFDGILIATTNLIDNFDNAFSRRFNYKIKFTKPDSTQRELLWNLLLPSKAVYKDKKEDISKKMSYFILTGAQIELIVKNTAYKVALRKDSIFCMEDFAEEVKKELSSSFGDEKSLGFIN